MTQSRFDTAFRHLLGEEGGYVNHPADRGGATNWGISLRFLKAEGKIDANRDGRHDLDLDMDGDMDVLVGMYSGTLAWYQNNGSGVFAKNILSTDVIGPWLTIGDLDGDGRNDIIATPDGGTAARARSPAR